MKLLGATFLLGLALPWMAAAGEATREGLPVSPPAPSAVQYAETESAAISILIVERDDGRPGARDRSRIAAGQFLPLFEGVRIALSGGWKQELSTQGLTLEGTRELSASTRILTFRAPRRAPALAVADPAAVEATLNFKIGLETNSRSDGSLDIRILLEAARWAQKILGERDKAAGQLRLRSMTIEGEAADTVMRVKLTLTPD